MLCIDENVYTREVFTHIRDRRSVSRVREFPLLDIDWIYKVVHNKEEIIISSISVLTRNPLHKHSNHGNITHDRHMNNKINKLHERSLRIVYKDQG